MKRSLTLLASLLALSLGVAFAQVATAEIPGVDETRPGSPAGTTLYQDDSVGEVVIRVRALDAGGNPVAGAPVAWALSNRTPSTVYVVGVSGGSEVPLIVFGASELNVDGGVTDENGEAYLVVDAQTAGELRMVVMVGGVEAKDYRDGDMRVVWF